MIEKLIILAALLIIGLISQKSSITIPVLLTIGLVLLRLNGKTLDTIKTYCINYGIILITVYAFIPIAKGDITLHHLIVAFTSWRAWVAIIAGILVTNFARFGIKSMSTSPDITTFVLVGIIIGILVFKGYGTGPLIGSGIAVTLFAITNFFISLFH